MRQATPLGGFRADTLRGFARALQLDPSDLHELLAGPSDRSGVTDDRSATVLDVDTANTVRLFNRAFTGDPLTPVDAMALFQTVIFSNFTPTIDGKYHHEAGTSYEFAAHLRGEVSIRDVDLLCDLPDFVLTQVNNHWLIRMGREDHAHRPRTGRGPHPRMECLADSFAAWIVISNTDTPKPRDFDDLYPGLRSASDVFGHDVDADDPDEEVDRIEWMDRVAGGLLPSDEDDDFRRYDLLLMDTYGQGVYDTADPRHTHVRSAPTCG